MLRGEVEVHHKQVNLRVALFRLGRNVARLMLRKGSAQSDEVAIAAISRAYGTWTLRPRKPTLMALAQTNAGSFGLWTG